ncbi:amidohydrolase family protein [Paenibacillus sp. NPDC057934]|uniref:amidohydrolase family protein n=1 Tax=Paenibacillus sp. NPDC057934 TaxID=3346282 RepID=UPI0036DEE888
MKNSEHYRSIIHKSEESVSQQKILIKGGTIISMDDVVGDFIKGDVLIEGSKILDIGAELHAKDAKIIDATGMIIIPGLIDAHRHSWQGILRQLMPNASSLGEYIDVTHNALATYYRPEDMYIGNLLTALGAIDGGITTIIDASHNARSPQHSDASIDAFEDAGLRAVYALGKPIAGEWAEHWPQDLERLQKERFSSKEQLITLGLLSQPDKENWDFARKLGLRIVSEFLGKEMSAVLPALKEAGLLGADNIFNHVTGLTEEAWEIIRDTGVNVVVDPRSDAQYALEEGIFAYQHAIDHGLKPALGIDIETSYSGDMFTEMKIAYTLQRASAQNRSYRGEENVPGPATVREILEAATISGARVAGLDNVTGSLTPGKEADIVLIRTNDFNIFPSNHALGTVVQGADRGNVDTVIIGGSIRKLNGKLLGVDSIKLNELVQESRTYLFESVNHQLDPLADQSPQFAEKPSETWTGL